MIPNDVYEPLEKFRDEFKDKFAQLTRDKFKTLTATSKVNVAANRKLSKEIHALESEADGLRTKRGWYIFLAVISFVGLAVAIIYGISQGEYNRDCVPICVGGGILGLVLGIFACCRASKLSEEISQLESVIAQKKQVAWDQMAPLNKLYTWDITAKLIQATVPKLEFDPYFSVERLESLRRDYNWSDCFAPDVDRSMLSAQSGVIKGNPFVVVHYNQMEWGTKAYSGYKDIHYYVTEVGADGKKHRRRVTETLTATVVKPYPEYYERKMLIYGNEAAPNLTFSRQPSGLDPQNAGIFTGIKKHFMAHSIVKHARNMSEGFTMMQNKEFETMFHATDRDHEVEFRVLFTPVAMLQMLSLMKDDKVGFGDDFAFYKQNMVNVIYAKHLNTAVIDTNPKVFKDWDYDRATGTFQEFNETYFKNLYFALAPLLAIPVYQQLRPHHDIWHDPQRRPASASWEHEAIANFHGQSHFKHPQSVTQNILKTRVSSQGNGESVVSCTAYGYRGVQRWDTERVYGGDGKWHPVRVEWTEYLPVHRTRTFNVCDSARPSPGFVQKVKAAGGCACRRSIYSCLGPA